MITDALACVHPQADLEARDWGYQTPLHMAAESGAAYTFSRSVLVFFLKMYDLLAHDLDEYVIARKYTRGCLYELPE